MKFRRHTDYIIRKRSGFDMGTFDQIAISEMAAK